MISFLALALAGTNQGVHLQDHPWDVTHLDLDVALDLDRGHVTGRATLDVDRKSPSPVLTLHQRHLRIDEVLVDEQPATYRTRLDRLEIQVPVDRESVRVAIRYETEPVAGLHFRGLKDGPKGEAQMVWSQGESEHHRYWFPSWDHPSDRFTVSTHLTVDGDHQAFAVGTLQKKTPLNNGRVRWSYALEEPVVNYLVAVVAGEVDEVEMPSDASAPLSMLLPKGIDPEAARRATEPTAGMFAYFEQVLDEPFPYPNYRQAFAPRFLHGGMENPGLVVLAERLKLDEPEEDPTHVHRVVAHELAHQWFGDLLTCRGWTELWLNEGFATYWAGRWEGDAKGEAWLAERVHRWHAGALRDPAPMAPTSATYTGRDNAGVYVQGASLLRMLEVNLGRPSFDASIRAWIDAHAVGLVTTGQLRQTIGEVTGREVGPWFDVYARGQGEPVLSSSWTWDAEANQLRVVVEQSDEEAPTVRLPLEIAIGTGEQTAVEHLQVGPGRTELVRTLDGPPDHVAVDPRGGLLAHWTREQTPQQWAHQAQHAASPYARLTALHSLHDQAEPVVLEVLPAILADDDEHDAIRRGAAEALATLPSETAARALQDALADAPSPALREALYGALGAQGEGIDLAVLVRGTRAAAAVERAEALDALVRVAPEKGKAVARRWLRAKDPNPQGQLHGAALQALQTAGDPDYLGMALPFLRSQARPWPQEAARRLVHAHLRKLDEDDPVRGLVLRRLEGMMATRDLRLKRRLIQTLGHVGDDDTMVWLRRWATGVRWDDLAERARSAAQSIADREPGAPPEAVELELLRDRLDALEGRVEELERY